MLLEPEDDLSYACRTDGMKEWTFPSVQHRTFINCLEDNLNIIFVINSNKLKRTELLAGLLITPGFGGWKGVREILTL